MKKTLSINLSGLVFTIDEDAYNKLQTYLHKLSEHFKDESDREIISDVETRIAEIFTERLNKNRTVVTLEDVDYVISTLGNPNQFDDENDIEDNSENESKSNNSKNKKKHRKFYRDVDNQIFGGVAAGLASYTGIDVSFIRIIFILLTIFSFSWMIVIYVILWIICPAAKTTSQKLEMQGIEPSIENIKEYINKMDIKNNVSSIGSAFGNFLKIFFKILAIIIGVIFCSVLIGVLGLLIVVSLSIIFGHYSFPGMAIPTSDTIIFVISLILTAILPILMIIVSIIQIFKRNNSKNNGYIKFLWINSIVWIIALIISLTLFFKHDFKPFIYNRYFEKNKNIYTEEKLNNVQYNSIKISSGVSAYLEKDSLNFVEIIGNENYLRNINLDTSKNTLYVSLNSQSHYNFYDDNKVIIHYSDTIDNISTSSAGSITNTSDTPLLVKNLKIRSNSAGIINLNIECDTLYVEASSSAEINLSGKAKCSYLNSSSAADINTKNMQCINSSILSSSAAKIIARGDSLYIISTSSGVVKYNKNCSYKIINVSSGGTAKPYYK